MNDLSTSLISRLPAHHLATEFQTYLMPISIPERLAELEQDPFDTDRMDVEALLRHVGYECYTHPQIDDMVLWEHSGWGSRYNFSRSQRILPVSYVLAICSNVRDNLEREGRL